MTDTARVTFRQGDEYYAVRPPLGSLSMVIRVAESAGEPGLLYTGKVMVETVGQDGVGRRRRPLLSQQLHDSPITASGKKRITGYVRLHPGQTAPRPADTVTAGPEADEAQAEQAAAALRRALDDAARGLRPLGLSLDGSPATWTATDSSTEWARRAGQLYETLVLLAARIEPYAATPEAAAARQ
ncbi:hypothetical protein [Streptomyces goshikiensis]|uniref:hypothetical protein n=1 Tax=Streptomyces goshikiensis TaxID=1942 RepID=UPI0036882697